MDEYHWYKELNDRTLRYGATPLDHNRVIAITASPAYLKTYDGQLAALVAANLLGRMTPAVVLAFDDVELHPALPWPGATLHSLSLSGMAAANPFGRYDARAAEPEDFRFHLGPDGSEHVVHGSGWNSYFGPAPSPLKLEASNGIGAALSVWYWRRRTCSGRASASSAWRRSAMRGIGPRRSRKMPHQLLSAKGWVTCLQWGSAPSAQRHSIFWL